MSDAENPTEATDARRERAASFINDYIDEHRELFDKLARE
jgi:hypothetical protein